jgi:hypothetical protein
LPTEQGDETVGHEEILIETGETISLRELAEI